MAGGFKKMCPPPTWKTDFLAFHPENGPNLLSELRAILLTCSKMYTRRCLSVLPRRISCLSSPSSSSLSSQIRLFSEFVDPHEEKLKTDKRSWLGLTRTQNILLWTVILGGAIGYNIYVNQQVY